MIIFKSVLDYRMSYCQGITAEDLANATGLSVNTINSLRIGRRKLENCSYKTLTKLRKAFGIVSIEHFLNPCLPSDREFEIEGYTEQQTL